MVDRVHCEALQIVNASISGSTSASAPSRMKWQMKEKPDALLLALGANDGLRGLPVKTLEDNLSQAIEIAQKEGVKVILGGMYLPPNYGADYGQKFKEVFKRLASKYKTPFIPFMLEGVAGHPEFNQADGIHPNEKGQAMVAETVYKALKAIL
jgi:acyl-CoA thioesterase-1